MRVAIYARVSTSGQAQAQTIEQQLTRLHSLAKQQGWTLSEQHIYRDDGFSGASLNRPGLDRLRDAAAQAAFDAVLITAPDRLARKYVERLAMQEVLEHVINQLAEAPDKATVRELLDIEGDKRRQRGLIMELVQHRFPGLVKYTEQQAEQITSLHYLYCLRNFLTRASDENEATHKIDLVASFDKKE